MELEKVNKITEVIIGAAMKVSNTLGVGFLEKVYENALVVELKKTGLKIEQQRAMQVIYEDVVVGYYIADLIIENTVLVELKSAKAIDDIHQAQLLNYLKATKLKIGLILNFGTSKLGIKRMAN